ncbi:MAG: DNA polymerase I [Anaerolineales bacterium]
MPARDCLYLIDGHALAYRTYFALSSIGGGTQWMTQSGEPTAGIYGFTSVLLRLMEQESPELLAVAFDTGRTFRDDLYAEYKATREKMPDDLRHQIDRIRQVVTAFGIPIFEAEGYEADDVLGTIARQAAAEGVEVVIITGDRDMLQLADEHVTIQLAGRRLADSVGYGPDKVQEKFGVRPDQLVDYKAMVGDTSDNIPGVRGVGKKTAVSLLEQYGTLEEIYKHLEDIPTRYRSKLEAGRENAFLSRQLATIVYDVPIEIDLEACRARQVDRQQVVELFRELEFRSLLNRIPPDDDGGPAHQLKLFSPGEASVPIVAGPAKTTIVDDAEKLHQLERRLEKASAIAFDVETTSTDAMQAKLVGISLAVSPEEGFYLPVGHTPATAGGPQLEIRTTIQALQSPLTDSRIHKVGHNLKYDHILLARHGLRAQPLTFDTMIAEWLIDPASRNLGLKNLAFIRLGVEMTEITELIGKGRNQRSMAEVPIAQVAPYAAADAVMCLRLMPELEAELEQKEQSTLFKDVEMPLIPVLAEMEIAGIGLDTSFLKKFSGQLAERQREIQQEIFKLVGHEFNLNSTQQLSVVLFDELGLQPPDRRRTASGHYSTAASVLAELESAHPVVELVLEQREVAKLKSTYADSLPKQVNPETGRVHTSYNQTGSVTGRLASSDPNLQNIPIRTDLGRQIRRAFVASPGQRLLGVDYSQIELRIVAHMADDKAMIQAFRDDQDIHATTAAAVFDCPIDEVTSAMRRRAKAINFGLIYGMSAFGLSRSTDLTLAESEDFVKAYFDRFPGVRRYLDQARQHTAEKGYVETLLGRRRYFPQLMRGATATTEAVRARALREAINAPIQGTAADIIKLAMLRLPAALEKAGLQARMLLQVHDELVFECPEAEVPESLKTIRQVMQSAYELCVPLKTDALVGSNWEQMKPYE